MKNNLISKISLIIILSLVLITIPTKVLSQAAPPCPEPYPDPTLPKNT